MKIKSSERWALAVFFVLLMVAVNFLWALNATLLDVRADVRNLTSQLSTLNTAVSGSQSGSVTGLLSANAERIDRLRERLVALITELHPNRDDRATIFKYRNLMSSAGSSSPFRLPFDVLDLAPELGAGPSPFIDGAIVVNVFNSADGAQQQQSKLIDVVAVADGAVVSMSGETIEVHGDREFYVVEVEHADGSRMMYGQLTKAAVEEGNEVLAGNRIGETDSGLGLALCLKLPGSENCVDPRPLMPPMSIIEIDEFGKAIPLK